MPLVACPLSSITLTCVYPLFQYLVKELLCPLLNRNGQLDIGHCHGADRDRTDDLRLAKPALSQLSYSPGFSMPAVIYVGLGRLELPTSPLSGVRSNHLSYRPACDDTSTLTAKQGNKEQSLERR
jgi:hypothetical protein